MPPRTLIKALYTEKTLKFGFAFPIHPFYVHPMGATLLISFQSVLSFTAANEGALLEEALRLDQSLRPAIVSFYQDQIPRNLVRFLERNRRPPTSKELEENRWQAAWNDMFVRFIVFENLSLLAKSNSKIKKEMSAEYFLEKYSYHLRKGESLNEDQQLMYARAMRFLKPFSGFIQFLKSAETSPRKVGKVWRHLPRSLSRTERLKSGYEFASRSIQAYRAESFFNPPCPDQLSDFKRNTDF